MGMSDKSQSQDNDDKKKGAHRADDNNNNNNKISVFKILSNYGGHATTNSCGKMTRAEFTKYINRSHIYYTRLNLYNSTFSSISIP